MCSTSLAVHLLPPLTMGVSVFLLLFWTPHRTKGIGDRHNISYKSIIFLSPGDVDSTNCYIKKRLLARNGQRLDTMFAINSPGACADLCAKGNIDCDTFIYSKPVKSCTLYEGAELMIGPSFLNDNFGGWCPGKGEKALN